MQKSVDKNLETLNKLNTKIGVKALLSREEVSVERSLRIVGYEKKLKKLQAELIKMQTSVIENNERVIVIFEGRDAAGKGGAIRRIKYKVLQKALHLIEPNLTV